MREAIIRVLEHKIDPSDFKKLESKAVIDDDSEGDEGKDTDMKLDFIDDGKYTISEISTALGMSKDEKTMSRILAELRKNHKEIESSAVRNGRVFQYKYYLKNTAT